MRFGRYDYAAFLTFFAYAAGSVIVPVSLVELAHDLGFSLESGGMSAGGALHLGRTVAMVLAMLAVGFIAGRWGNRSTLGTSVLLMSAGIAACALAPGYGILFFAMLLAGLGEGVIEGLATPFVQGLHPKEPGRYINLTHSFWSVGILATVLLSGWLLSAGVSWRTLTSAVALVGCLAGCMILIPSKKGTPAVPHNPLPPKAVLANATRILKCARFWRYYAAMFLAGGGEFCLTFWSASHIRLHYGGAAWTGGLGVALFALAMDGTMLLILLSCAGVPGCGAFTYLMGVMGNQSGSLTDAFYLVPAAYALIALLIATDRGRKR